MIHIEQKVSQPKGKAKNNEDEGQEKAIERKKEDRMSSLMRTFLFEIYDQETFSEFKSFDGQNFGRMDTKLTL